MRPSALQGVSLFRVFFPSVPIVAVCTIRDGGLEDPCPASPGCSDGPCGCGACKREDALVVGDWFTRGSHPEPMHDPAAATLPSPIAHRPLPIATTQRWPDNCSVRRSPEWAELGVCRLQMPCSR